MMGADLPARGPAPPWWERWLWPEYVAELMATDRWYARWVARRALRRQCGALLAGVGRSLLEARGLASALARMSDAMPSAADLTG